jgi:hypothetical protein
MRGKHPASDSETGTPSGVAYEQAATILEESLTEEQRHQLRGLVASGSLKKFISLAIEAAITALLRGVGASGLTPMDALTAYHNGTLSAEIEAHVPPDQLAQLNGLGFDWKKLLLGVIRAVIDAVASAGVGAPPEAIVEEAPAHHSKKR